MTYRLWWLCVKNALYLFWICGYALVTDLVPQKIYFDTSKIILGHFKLDFMFSKSVIYLSDMFDVIMNVCFGENENIIDVCQGRNYSDYAAPGT